MNADMAARRYMRPGKSTGKAQHEAEKIPIADRSLQIRSIVLLEV